MFLKRISLAAIGWFLLSNSVELFQWVQQYLHPSSNLEFIADHLHHYLHWRSWRVTFFIHAFLAPLTLFTGLYSMLLLMLPSSMLRRTWVKASHRWAGKAYLGLVLFAVAPTGLYMSFFATGGVAAKMAFVTLSFLWFGTSYRGYQWIRAGRVAEHTVLMTWSFGLACAAIVQRKLAFILRIAFNSLAPESTDMVYPLSGWGGWLLTTAVTFLVIRTVLKKRPTYVISCFLRSPFQKEAKKTVSMLTESLTLRA